MGLMDRVEKNQSLYSFTQAMKQHLELQLQLKGARPSLSSSLPPIVCTLREDHCKKAAVYKSGGELLLGTNPAVTLISDI